MICCPVIEFGDNLNNNHKLFTFVITVMCFVIMLSHWSVRHEVIDLRRRGFGESSEGREGYFPLLLLKLACYCWRQSNFNR